MKKLIWMLLVLVLHTPCAAGEGLLFRMIDVGMAECMIVTAGDEIMVVDTPIDICASPVRIHR